MECRDFYASESYFTSFPIEYLLNNDIILADNLNGMELPPESGFPLQLVAEQIWGTTIFLIRTHFERIAAGLDLPENQNSDKNPGLF